MAQMPKRLCMRRGCSGIFDPNTEYCSACGTRPAKPVGWKPDRERGTRQERGYDEAWLKLRARKLGVDPLCEECLQHGRTEAAAEVHHTRPFHGRQDSNRLRWSNLESLCTECHKRKTKQRANGIGGKKE